MFQFLGGASINRNFGLARKQYLSMTQTLGEAVSDVANAASVAATGSEIGVLELAAEGEFKPGRSKRSRKVKAAPKKKGAAKRPGKRMKKKRAAKRR
jgi:hypothetical protein